jgi:hypothetical protein
MSKPTIAIPTVTAEEVEQLTELRGSVRRVHKSVPPHSPVRMASTQLSDRLQQLHRRGVPLHTLADIVGLSHQAVRVRVRGAASTVNGHASPAWLKSATMLDAPIPDVVLVTDAGVHRRLHVYDPPENAGSAYLAMIPSIPMLDRHDAIVGWLESESDQAPSEAAPITATRLRVPPAVYLPRAILDSVLVPLTTDDDRESRSDDAEHESDSSPEE